MKFYRFSLIFIKILMIFTDFQWNSLRRRKLKVCKRKLMAAQTFRKLNVCEFAPAGGKLLVCVFTLWPVLAWHISYLWKSMKWFMKRKLKHEMNTHVWSFTPWNKFADRFPKTKKTVLVGDLFMWGRRLRPALRPDFRWRSASLCR